MAIDDGNGLSGSLGGNIYYTRNGKKCVRSMPAHVRNPKTTGQVNQRMKIRQSSQFIRLLYSFIKIGYQATTLDSPFNEARQHIMKNAFTGKPGDPVLNFKSVMIARGGIKQPEEYSLVIEGKNARINWKTPVKHDWTNPSDEVLIAMYCENGKNSNAFLKSNAASRGDGTVLIPVPLHAKPLQVWMFFYNPNYSTGEHINKISDSVYLGEIS